jgi:hypothetical protein
LSANRRAEAPVTESNFDECPRCGEPAGALVAAGGELRAVDCSSCHLSPSSVLTVWDMLGMRQLEHRPVTVEEAVTLAREANIMISVWEGDVKVAAFYPGYGAWYSLGRCS